MKNIAKAIYTTVYKIKDKLCPGLILFDVPGFREIGMGLRYSARKESIQYRNHLLYLDPLDSLQLTLWGDFDSHILKKLAAWIKPDSNVIDIGAHIGIYTLELARCVGPQGHVFSFEPDPETRAILDKNISANHYANVQVFPFAVGACRHEAQWFKCSTNTGNQGLFQLPEHSAQKSVTKVIPLDEVDRLKNQRIDFIKIDIQGGEYYAWQGMRRLLERNPDMMIIIEYEPRLLKSAGCKPDDLLGAIFEFGKFVYELNPNGTKRVFQSDIPASPESKIYSTNLLVSKREISL